MSDFSKKHYERIAVIFRNTLHFAKSKQYFMEEFVELFRADSSKFDAERFREACREERKER